LLDVDDQRLRRRRGLAAHHQIAVVGFHVEVGTGAGEGRGVAARTAMQDRGGRRRRGIRMGRAGGARRPRRRHAEPDRIVAAAAEHLRAAAGRQRDVLAGRIARQHLRAALDHDIGRADDRRKIDVLQRDGAPRRQAAGLDHECHLLLGAARGTQGQDTVQRPLAADRRDGLDQQRLTRLQLRQVALAVAAHVSLVAAGRGRRLDRGDEAGAAICHRRVGAAAGGQSVTDAHVGDQQIGTAGQRNVRRRGRTGLFDPAGAHDRDLDLGAGRAARQDDRHRHHGHAVHQRHRRFLDRQGETAARRGHVARGIRVGRAQRVPAEAQRLGGDAPMPVRVRMGRAHHGRAVVQGDEVVRRRSALDDGHRVRDAVADRARIGLRLQLRGRGRRRCGRVNRH
ncbi:conserved hypothetical protein, partial [Ricinus communis]